MKNIRARAVLTEVKLAPVQVEEDEEDSDEEYPGED